VRELRPGISGDSLPCAIVDQRTSQGRLPAQLWIVCVGAAVNRFGSFVQVFLVIYLHHERGYSATAAGAAVAVYGLGSLSSAAAGGVLADQIGHGRAIVTSMFMTAGILVAIPSISPAWLLVPLLGLAGFATDLYRPAAAALIGSLAPAAERLTAFGLYRLSIGVGYAAGLTVAGFVAAQSFHLVFFVDAATSVAFGLVAAVALTDRRIRPTPRDGWQPLGTPLLERPFVLLLIASALTSFVFFQNGSTLPLQIRDSGYSLPQFGSLMALQGIIVTVLVLPVTRLARGLATATALTAGALLVGIGFSLTAVAGSLAAPAATILVWSLGEVLWSPVAQTRSAELAPAGYEGRYQGALGLAWTSGLVLSPLAGTAIYAWQPEALWLACGILASLAAAIVHASARPDGKARTAG
jgi:MFS family permease